MGIPTESLLDKTKILIQGPGLKVNIYVDFQGEQPKKLRQTVKYMMEHCQALYQDGSVIFYTPAEKIKDCI